LSAYGFTIVSGITNGLTYGALGIAFGLVFFVTGRFHYAFGLFYSVAGVIAGWGYAIEGWPLAVAVVVGLAAGTIAGILSEILVYRQFDRRAPNASLLGVFIASLGMVIAGEALMSMVFDQAASFNLPLVSPITWRPGNIPVPLIDVVISVTCVVLLVIVDLVVTRSSLGRQMRAAESNQRLASIFGVNVKRVFVAVFVVASFVGAVLGILQAAASSATPQMGDSIIIFAIVVAFLGHGRSVLAHAVIGVLLGVFEGLIGLWFGALLQSLVVFVILFLFILGVAYLGGVRMLLQRRSVV
jgi:branched-subunit amino acid ABC-type transport system permease component